eukprot:1066422-Rhodomonas_salina.1
MVSGWYRRTAHVRTDAGRSVPDTARKAPKLYPNNAKTAPKTTRIAQTAPDLAMICPISGSADHVRRQYWGGEVAWYCG